jgi:hypothetical protein
MGGLPALGRWVRLEVPAAAVGLAGATVSGMAFTLHGGQASWDAIGVRNPSDWVDDALPRGSATMGTWTWSSNPAPVSGRRIHSHGLAPGLAQHVVAGAVDQLNVPAGSVLFANAFLDPANPPRMIMLQWFDGTWEHRAFWGEDRWPFGTAGTQSRRSMGALPLTGRWVRLESRRAW